MTTSELSLYHRLARYYDDIYAEKDYRSESKRLVTIARRYGRSSGETWLDVACGTGRHLEFLDRTYSSAGVDSSREMLRIARRRLPGVRLVHGDMRRFRINRRFDVVSCLFSAIGHLRSERDLLMTFRNFERHLKPGGVAIVEPWLDPTKFRSGMVHVRTYSAPTVKVVRGAFSSRRGNLSIIRYHYLVAEQDRGIRHFEEIDIGLMVPPRRLRELLNEEGFESRFLPDGFMADRGLLIGTKSGRSSRSQSR